MVREWIYLLYDEFFMQGDEELRRGLPVSFLCNRDTTCVPKAQPGFLTGISIPLWSAISEVMPGMLEFVESAKDNTKKWETYEETDEEKRIYKKPE